jgi:hypothetical protein
MQFGHLSVCTAAMTWAMVGAATGAWSAGVQVIPHMSNATAVSDDGRAVAGWSPGQWPGNAVRWTPSAGTQVLGRLSNDFLLGSFGQKVDMSADGSVVTVGPDLWIEGRGLVRLPTATISDPTGYLTSVEAVRVSANGRYVVGSLVFAYPDGTNVYGLYTYDLERGVARGDVEYAGLYTGGEFAITAVANDGSVLLTRVKFGSACVLADPSLRDTTWVSDFRAWSMSGDASQLFGYDTIGRPGVYNARSGIRPLVGAPEVSGSVGDETFVGGSQDQTVFCGTVYGNTPTTWLWTEDGGFRELNAALADMGVSLGALGLARITRVSDISADGRYIAGQALDLSGASVGVLITVPEPGVAAAAAGCVALGLRRRNRDARGRTASSARL